MICFPQRLSNTSVPQGHWQIVFVQPLSRKSLAKITYWDPESPCGLSWTRIV
jgi:hypothetical protein